MEYKKFLKRLAALTDENSHNEARILIAKQFGFTLQLGQLQSIKSMHEMIGHMPQDLINKRTDITARMMERIEKTNGIEMMREVYSKL